MDELLRAEDRAVDVGLGREVDDRGAARGRARDRVRVGDVAVDELVLDALEVGGVAGIGELVEHRDLGAALGQPANEVRADEARPAGDEHAHRERVAALTRCPASLSAPFGVVRPKRSTVISFLVVLLLAAVGVVAYVVVKLDVFAPSLSEQVSKVEGSSDAWWLGKTFDGKAARGSRTRSRR